MLSVLLMARFMLSTGVRDRSGSSLWPIYQFQNKVLLEGGAGAFRHLSQEAQNAKIWTCMADPRRWDGHLWQSGKSCCVSNSHTAGLLGHLLV